MLKRIYFVAACLAIFLVAGMLGAPLHAQTYTEGSIAGTVFDASGAVVANADILIHNDGTNAETHLTSDGSGFFKAPLLPAASYTVTVNASGFTPYKEISVIVEVSRTTEVNPHLAAGSAGATTVEVTAEAPILDFESPDISAVLSTRNIEDLPLNGERWSDLTLLTPAATADTSGFGLIAFRAISTLLNNVEIDGADDNQAYYSEERGRTREGYSTSKFMIQEFQVNTGVYSAEFGRAAGGVINAISKTGTNDIHGVAFFSDRDNDWGAFNPFTTNTYNTGSATAPAFTTVPYKPKDWRKEWGFDAGGPIVRDKLFWFYGYNQYHRNFPGTAKANTPSSFFTLPDAELPSGYTCNFTDVMTGGKITAGRGYISPPAGGTAASTTDQMACTLAVRLNAAGYGAYGNYAAGASAYSTQLVNLLGDLGSVPRQGYEVLNTPKIDWQVNEKHHVSVLYHRLRWDSPGGVQTQATNNYSIDTFGTDFVKLDYGLAKLDSLITNTITNELRYQYGRELNDEGQQPLSAYTKQYLQGNNGNTAAGGGFSPNVPEVALNTSVGMYLGSPYYSYRKALPDERKWQVGDSATWVKGNHAFKFGVDLIHNYDVINNTYEGNGVYTYSYYGNYFADLLNEGSTAGVCNSVSTVTAPGSATTDYVGTAPCGTMVQGFGPAVWGVATTDYGFFGEDHWKLTPKLTIDLGLRYDYESFPDPYSSLTAANGTFTPFLASSNGLCAAYTGPGTCPTLAAQANISNRPSDKTDFGPRIGMALDPFGDGKTTVRAGFGIFVGRTNNGMILNTYLNSGSPAGQYVSATVKPNTPGAPLFPNIISTAAGSTPSSYFFSSNFKNPEVYEFDLAIQRELAHNTVAQISYMGALGRRLPNALNINFNPNANTATSGTPNGVVTSVVTVADSTGSGPIPSGTIFQVPTYTGFLNTNFGTVNEAFSNITSNYNAAVVELEDKTSKRFQYDVNYTWSHALDYNQNANTNNLSNGWIDPYNIDGFAKGGNYGNSQWDIPNRLVVWGLLNSPSIEKDGWLSELVNHWSLAPMFQAQNGLPYSAAFQSGSASLSAYSSGINGAGTSTWIPYIGHNNYSQRRTMVADARLEKQLVFHRNDHGMTLHLIGEAFNISNHQNVTGVQTSAYTLSANSSVTSGCSVTVPGQSLEECSTMTFVPLTGAGHLASGFKAITNTNSNFAYSTRQMQLALRFDF